VRPLRDGEGRRGEKERDGEEEKEVRGKIQEIVTISSIDTGISGGSFHSPGSKSCSAFNDPEIIREKIFFISFLAGDLPQDPESFKLVHKIIRRLVADTQT